MDNQLPLDSKVDKIGFLTCLIIEQILEEQWKAVLDEDVTKIQLLEEVLLMTIESMIPIEE